MKIFALIVVILVLIEVVQLLRLKAQISSYQNFWSKNNSQNIDQQKVEYVALGDSAAQGIGASKPENGYVGLLIQELGVSKTFNLSKSGAKVKDVTDLQLPRLADLNTDEKTIITLDIGGNDMSTFDSKIFQRDIDQLFSQLPRQTIVADVPYFGGGRLRKYQKNVDIANKILRASAEKYNLVVAPLLEITKTRDSLLVYSADFFHPSDTGYRNWRDAFLSVLR